MVNFSINSELKNLINTKKVKNEKKLERKFIVSSFIRRKQKMFQFKRKQKKFLVNNFFIETSRNNKVIFKFDRRFVNKRFFYQYKLSQKRRLSNFYIDKSIKNNKLIALNYKHKKKRIIKENEPDFWLFIKPTVNNLFAYIYNVDVLRHKSLLKKRRRK